MINSFFASMDDIFVDTIFAGTTFGKIVETLSIRFIFTEKDFRLAVSKQIIFSNVTMIDRYDPIIIFVKLRLVIVDSNRPCISKPYLRQNVEVGTIRAEVISRNTN